MSNSNKCCHSSSDFYLIDLIEHDVSLFPDEKIFGKTRLWFKCKTDEKKITCLLSEYKLIKSLKWNNLLSDPDKTSYKPGCFLKIFIRSWKFWDFKQLI